jgi:D-sedoheptulose 7-phosphate isomerase
MASPTPLFNLKAGVTHRYFEESRRALEACERDPGFLESIDRIALAISEVLRGGGKVLLCGNGGSAADAQHIAGELSSRFESDRMPLAAISLTSDSSVLTAVGNDYGFEQVFARQVNGLGRSGDAVVGLSTSGRSANVLNGLSAARANGLLAIGFTGADGGQMHEVCDLLLRAPSARTPVIQQVHMTAAHVICELVEQQLGLERPLGRPPTASRGRPG